LLLLLLLLMMMTIMTMTMKRLGLKENHFFQENFKDFFQFLRFF